ncbi:MAG: LemA family protein [Actinomycetota bacterium]|nr:LemA family protein [Actinomycetota bacterium]
MIPYWPFIVAALLAVAGVAFSWRRFQRQIGVLEYAWVQLEEQLERRHDLADRLVELVRSVVADSEPWADNVATARKSAAELANSTADAQRWENELAFAVRALLDHVDGHPELNGNVTFRNVTHRLIAVDGRILGVVDAYNELARYYNRRIERPPTSIISRIARFRPVALLDLEPTMEDEH